MSNVKQLRGQVRQIVKELLPEVLKQELAQALYKELQNAIAGQLSVISANVTQNLEEINNRQKDISSFIMREVIAVKDRHADNKVQVGEEIKTSETVLETTS